MTNSKTTKRSLLFSALALIMCISMLIGSTFAWFTDSVTSSGNIIKSGKLDVSMMWLDGTLEPSDDADWKDASKGAIFNYEKWEPGFVQARHIKISNDGNLALKYMVDIIANGEVSALADVIDVYYIDGATKLTSRTHLTDANKLGTLSAVLANVANDSNATYGELLEGEKHTVTLALKMQETAGNEYEELAIGTDFSVKLIATQLAAEEDSFDENYDKGTWLGEADTDWYDADATSYTLTTAGELAGLSKLVNSGVKFDKKTVTLGANIDLENIAWTPIGINAIGSDAKYFSGVFDGADYTISNLCVNAPAKTNVGLFGVVAHDATVKNVNIENATVKGESNVGALAGLAYNSVTIDNCHVTGNIVVEGNYKVGGLVGGDYFVLTNSSVGAPAASTFSLRAAASTGYVKATYKQKDLEGDNVGGVAGFVAEGSAVMDNNSAYIDVEGTRKVGGIFGSIGANRKVTNSYYSGNVTSNATGEYLAENYSKLFVGGIVGEMTGENCVITGNTAVATVNGYSADTTGAIVGGTRKTTYDIAAINAANNGSESTVNANTAVAGSSTEVNSAIAAGNDVILTDDITYNTNIKKDASINLAGNTFEATKTIELGNNADLTMSGGDYAVNSTYGHIDVRPTSAEGSEVYFEDVNFAFNKLGKTYGPSTNRLGSVLEFCATANGGKAVITFKNCTFNNAQVVFEGLSSATGEFEATFENCTFNALTSSAPIYVQNYVKGTLNVIGCTFNLECTSATASAISVSSSTSTSVVVNAKDNTFNAVAVTPYTYDASKGEDETYNVKVNGTPADIKFISIGGSTSSANETNTTKTGIAK